MNTKTPKSLSGNEIRQKFLQFYQKRDHQILPSASLVPDDPTVLLTIAGMLPFKPIFLGQKPAPSPRATTAQKCIRTNDIENVGRTARHHTFFEMLGNFSFGDYFKEQAILWAWELSTKVFKLPPERLIPSVYQEDEEAFTIWRDKIGIPPHRIQRMGEDDNFWVSGPTGPCGPCSEIYYDFHPEQGDEVIDLEDDTRFIEFYNLVFMQYNRDVDGKLTPLAKQNIDTGMGLERMAQILQKVPNNYETDLIFPIIQEAAKLAKIDYQKANEQVKTSLKVIGDHVRAIVHLSSDGVTASNLGRGYILRRLIRRVVRHGRLLGMEGEFINLVAEKALELAQDIYPQVRERERVIKDELAREEAQFLKTLERGEKLLADIIGKQPQQISGEEAFTLYDTYGFPLELTQEIAEEQGLTVDTVGFEREMKKQRDRSREAHETIDLTVQESLDKLAAKIHPTEFLGYFHTQGEGKVEAVLVDGKTVDQGTTGTVIQVLLDRTPFYAESGGQVGDRGELIGPDGTIKITDVQKESGIFIHYGEVTKGTIKPGEKVLGKVDLTCRRRAQANHTATHLLQSALKKIVDESISQAGSLVDFDRLRFDFHYHRALTPEQIAAIENQVNSWITENHGADVQIMSLDQAKAKGAIAMFGEKYGQEVRVVDFPGVSMELCGGIHVHNTSEIGAFKIISEAAIASGVRRLEAVAGPAMLDYLNVRDQVVKELSDRFKAKPEEIPDRVHILQTELKSTQKQLEALKQELAIVKSDQLLTQVEKVSQYQILVAELPDTEAESLKTVAERLQQKLGKSAVVLGSTIGDNKVNLVAAFSPEINQDKKLQAGKFIGEIAKICDGKGGGRPNLAQAGGKNPSQLGAALATAKIQLLEALQ